MLEADSLGQEKQALTHPLPLQNLREGEMGTMEVMEQCSDVHEGEELGPLLKKSTREAGWKAIGTFIWVDDGSGREPPAMRGRLIEGDSASRNGKRNCEGGDRSLHGYDAVCDDVSTKIGARV